MKINRTLIWLCDELSNRNHLNLSIQVRYTKMLNSSNFLYKFSYEYQITDEGASLIIFAVPTKQSRVETVKGTSYQSTQSAKYSFESS